MKALLPALALAITLAAPAIAQDSKSPSIGAWRHGLKATVEPIPG